MAKRTENGGHSTKPIRPDDKRLSQNKALIAKYVSEDFDYDKFKELMNTLLKNSIKGDTKAASLFLAYVVGKPVETKEIDITSSGDSISINYIIPSE